MVTTLAAARAALHGAAGWVLRKTAQTPAYDAIPGGRRWTGYAPPEAAVNAILAAGAGSLRRVSRDMARKNPWASAGLRVYAANAIGTGIKPQSRHPDAAARQRIQEAWLAWTDEADATGTLDFYGLQGLAVRAVREGGEVFARLLFPPPTDDRAVPLQVQLIEPEQIPATFDRPLPTGNTIRQGIEFDPVGRRVAYHVLREHPGERLFGAGGDTVRVPAAEMAHVFEPVRPGQARGQPWLAQVLLRLYEFDHYEGAELVRKRDAAMFSGFIREVGGPDGGPLGGSVTTDANGQPAEVARLEPGTFQKLRPAEDVTFAAPADMGEGYAEFMRWVLRAIATCIGVTYEQLTGDLTGVNYSSIRAGLLEFRRAVEMFQHCVFAHQFCRPVWRAWMDRAVLVGALPVSATTYRRERAAWRAVKWVPPGWQWVDPEKEIKATVAAIRAGLLSRSEAVSAYGYDAEEIDAEIAADNKRADDLGVAYDSDGRRARSTGAAVEAPAADMDETAMLEERRA